MRLTVFAAIALASLGGCLPENTAEQPEAEADCGAKAMQHLVGQPSGAQDFGAGDAPVRILPPGSAMTMDHRPDRLNVELDADGVITRIWCG